MSRPNMAVSMKCNQCGSKLIQIKQQTKRFGNQLSKVTSVKFRCSDPSCQDKIDKKIEEITQQRLERAAKSLARRTATTPTTT